MDKADLSGVELALAGLMGEPEKRAAKPRVTRAPRKRSTPTRQAGPTQEPKGASVTESAIGSTASNEPARPRTRTGRPPGRRSGETPPKRKTTLSLNSDLMDAYAERSWEEKLQLGELVGRALEFYRERKWGRDA